MSDRTVKTVITADVRGFVAGMASAAASAKSFATNASRNVASAGQAISKVASENSLAWGTASTVMLAAGAAIAGGLALSAKAAISWESDWAGVTKTVNGSAAQMAALEGQLRGLAKTMPATHSQIAAVAEAAGQLGIQRENVAGFTKVMLQLGATTNLTADAAATMIAQFINITGTPASQVDRLASTLVALGNAGASTEAQIMEMGQRIAAAGKQVSMSETEILGLANAIASTGMNAEAGGTAISKSLIDINTAVRESGAGLSELATLTGQTTAQFKRSWQTDAAGALASVVSGLGKLKASGGDVDAALSKLGISGQYQTDVMKRLALATKAAGGQQDLLSESLELGKSAWDANNALVAEHTKRADTAASKFQVALNNVTDAGITLGSTMLPAISGVLDAVTGLVDGFGRLPQPVQTSLVAISAVTAGALLLAGGLMKAVTWAQDMKAAFAALRVAMSEAKISFTTAGIAAAGIAVGLAVVGAAVASFMSRQQALTDATNDYTQALEQSSGAIDENVQALAAKRLSDDGALAAAQKLGISLADVSAAALGNADAMSRVQEAIAKYQGQSEQVATGGGQYTTALTEQGEAAKTLSGSLATNRDAFANAAVAAKQYEEANSSSTTATSAATTATAQLATQTDAQTTAMKGALDVLQQYANKQLKLSGGQIAFEAAIDDATAALERNGKTLDRDTEKGRANETSLNGLANAGMSLISTMVEQDKTTAELTAAQGKASAAFVTAATKMGMTKEKAKELAASYFAIPSTVSTNVTDSGTASSTETRLKNVYAAIQKIPADKQVEILALVGKGDLAAAESKIAYLTRDRTIYARVSVDGTGAGKYSLKAAGGIMEYYAGGGVRDVPNRHVAEIAHRGTIRVWNEPETAGEGYVPLADDWRRPRAKAVVSELARRFGGEARWFASGAVLQPGVASSPGSSMSVQSVSPEALAAALAGVPLRIDLANGRAWFDLHADARDARTDAAVRRAGVR